MNSTSIKIKKFLSNRNTVIILCAVIAVVVLFVGYNMRVNSAIQPVEVPYAKVTIQPKQRITDDMIGYMRVPQAALDTMGSDNIITQKEKVIDKYSNINTMIPEGSLFYNGAVVEKDNLPDNAVYDIPKGEILYKLNVNMDSTYVNSIVPNGFIDIFITITDSNTGQVRVGKFIEKIKVLAVKTSDGDNVFENSEEKRIPAYILFSVPDETNILLTSALALGLQVSPVPVNASNFDETPEKSNITSQEIKEYIESLSSEFLQDNGTLTQPTTPASGSNNNDKNSQE